MRRWPLCALIALALTTGPSVLWAQAPAAPSPLQLSFVPQYGLSLHPSFWSSGYGRFGDGWGLDQSTRGLQVEAAPVSLGRFFAVVGRSDFGLGCESTRSRNCDPSGWMLGLGASLTPTAHLDLPIVPFVGSGAGLLRWDGADVQLVTQAHAGADVLLSHRLSVRAELRFEPEPISAIMVYLGARWHLSPGSGGGEVTPP